MLTHFHQGCELIGLKAGLCLLYLFKCGEEEARVSRFSRFGVFSYNPSTAESHACRGFVDHSSVTLFSSMRTRPGKLARPSLRPSLDFISLTLPLHHGVTSV